MRRDLPVEELTAFLQQPYVATLAIRRADGTILLSPVWHKWSDRGFSVVLGKGDVKERRLRRDPTASLVVYDNAPRTPAWRFAPVLASWRATTGGR